MIHNYRWADQSESWPQFEYAIIDNLFLDFDRGRDIGVLHESLGLI